MTNPDDDKACVTSWPVEVTGETRQGEHVSRLRRYPPLDFTEEHGSMSTPISAAWKMIGDNLMVIVSESLEADGKLWLHVSTSRPTRLPSWQDLRRVKDAFVGKDKKAIQVLPSATEHVNIHPYCLHLFHCLEGDSLPDFRRGSGL